MNNNQGYSLVEVLLTTSLVAVTALAVSTVATGSMQMSRINVATVQEHSDALNASETFLGSSAKGSEGLGLNKVGTGFNGLSSTIDCNAQTVTVGNATFTAFKNGAANSTPADEG